MKIRINGIRDLIIIAFRRIIKHKDITIAICGKKGNAKSSLMLDLGIQSAVLRKYYSIYHSLKIDSEKLKNITVDFEKDVLQYITWIPSQWLGNMLKAPKFTVVGLDEAGNAWNNRRFNQEVNKILNETQQSNRFLGQIKVLTMPSLKDIDTGGRANANFFIDMFKQGKGKVYFLVTNSYNGKQYRYAIKIHGQDYIISIDPLPDPIYRIYEKKKASTEVKRYLERIEKLKKIEEYESKYNPLSMAAKMALELLEKSPDLILNKRKKLDAIYLSAKARVSTEIAYRIKRIYDKEGIAGLRELL